MKRTFCSPNNLEANQDGQVTRLMLYDRHSLQSSILYIVLTGKYLQTDVGAPRVKPFSASGGIVDRSSASSSRGHPFLRFRPDVRSTSAAASVPSVSSILRSIPFVELLVQPMAGYVLRRGGPVSFRGVRETCRRSNDLFRDLEVEQHDGTHDREKR